MCKYCGNDPFEYVNVGVGLVPVAVTCCEAGYALYQLDDEQLADEMHQRSLEIDARIRAQRSDPGYQDEEEEIPF